MSKLPPAPEVGSTVEHQDKKYKISDLLDETKTQRRFKATVSGSKAPLCLIQRPSGGEHTAFENEIDCLTRIHEEQRVHLLPIVVANFEHEASEFLVTEQIFAPQLSAQWDVVRDPEVLSLCFEQIFLAISKVHQTGFVLGDLNPDSFVRDDEGRVQLVGFSRVTRRGTPVRDFAKSAYGAPELSADSVVDERTDIFSAGAILASAHLQTPFTDENVFQVIEEAKVLKPVITQLFRGSIGPRESRFLSVDEMRVLLYQLKNEQALFPRPSAAMSSTVGVSQHRYINEDSAGFNELGVQYQSRPQHLGFYCVADGMGGHELGERASQLAVLGALQAFRQITQEVPFDRLQHAMPAFGLAVGRAASEVVCSGAEQFPGGARMGTTFTGALVINDELAVAHVGDSRGLLVRDGKLTPLTLDHSLVASLVRVGQMTEEEAAVSDERNVLIRCIDARVPMDESGFDSLVAIGYEDGRLKLRAGDAVLILSDGVWGVLSDDDLLKVVEENEGSQAVADQIVLTALQSGSDDNSTAMVVIWS